MNDVAILDVIAEWKQTAQDEVDDIAGWRDATERRREYVGDPRRYWRDLPRAWRPRTALLLGELYQQWPQLDWGAVQRVTRVIAVWHQEKAADRLPSQNELEMDLEAALTAMTAVEHHVHQQAVEQQRRSSEHSVSVDHNGDVHVDGKHQALTAAQKAVIGALVDVRPGRLTQRDLIKKSGREGARQILDRLSKMDPWKDLILKPRRSTSEGYGIR